MYACVGDGDDVRGGGVRLRVGVCVMYVCVGGGDGVCVWSGMVWCGARVCTRVLAMVCVVVGLGLELGLELELGWVRFRVRVRIRVSVRVRVRLGRPVASL